MLPKQEWWEVIGKYNESIFPLQWIGLLLIVGLTAYLIFGEQKRANVFLKASLSGINAFIGIRFFLFSEGFPLPLRISQGLLFLIIGVLMGMDLKKEKLEFQFPKTGSKRVLFFVGMVLMALYPFVGGILGKEMRYWIMPGTLPCPTTAYTLLLIITGKKRENFVLFIVAMGSSISTACSNSQISSL